MAWLAVDADGTECIFENEPIRNYEAWECDETAWMDGNYVLLPRGSVKKLIGKDLTWQDDPVELEEE